MSLLYLFLILINVGNIFSRALSLSLDIDVGDAEILNKHTSQLDNVFYTHLTPKINEFIITVNQSGVTIWKSSGYGSCAYALVALYRNEPYLLYLKIDEGYALQHRFYSKTTDLWLEVDQEQYRYLIFELGRRIKLENYFSLDVFNPTNDMYYTVEYATKEKPYTYITPNVGYLANSVEYRGSRLWSAKKYGDRCVAVWAHIKSASYYMIRLLVTRYNEESEIHTFFIRDGKWVLVDVLDSTHMNKYSQNPSNFTYPNYKFILAESYSSEGINNSKLDDVKEFMSKQDSDKSVVETSNDEEDTELNDRESELDEEYTELNDQESELDEEYTELNDQESELDEEEDSYLDAGDELHEYVLNDQDVYEDSGFPPYQETMNLETELNEDTSTELEEGKVLHLSGPTSGRVKPESRCVDGVLYKIYKFSIDDAPSKVVDTYTIWEAESEAESCLYVLSALSHGNPHTLYLIIDVYGERRGLYFFKFKGGWVKTSLRQYMRHIEEIKPELYLVEPMDLSLKEDNNNVTIEYNDVKLPNYLILPKVGYTWRKVTYKQDTIWEAEPDERCIAVWSYESDEVPYCVRVLSTGYYKSNLVSYLNKSGKWEKLLSYNELSANKVRLSGPANFYNPEYEFNQYPEYESQEKGVETKRVKEKEDDQVLKQTEVSSMSLQNEQLASVDSADKDGSDRKVERVEQVEESSPVNSSGVEESTNKTSETEKTEVMSCNDEEKIENKENEHQQVETHSEEEERLGDNSVKPPSEQEKQDDVRFNQNGNKGELGQMEYKPIINHLDNNMISIDVSSNSSNKYMTEALYDKRLRLMSYQAPAGHYFDLVLESNKQLFYGTPETSLCYEVNLYFKEGYYYLCDLLVRNKYTDVTMYNRFEDGVWMCISKKEYVASIQELKARL